MCMYFTHIQKQAHVEDEDTAARFITVWRNSSAD